MQPWLQERQARISSEVSRGRLVQEERVGQVLPAEGHQVRPARRYGLRRQARVVQLAGHDDRHPHRLLDSLRPLQVDARRVVPAGAGGVARGIVDAAGDVEGVHSFFLQDGEEGQDIIEFVASLYQLGRGEAEEHREVLSGLPLDLGDDLPGEVEPSQRGEAVFVLALVAVGREELVDQVTVGPVYLHRVETGVAGPHGGGGEAADQLLDLLFAQFAGGYADGPGRYGGRGHRLFPDHLWKGLSPGVMQLERHCRPFVPDGSRQFLQAAHELVVVSAQFRGKSLAQGVDGTDLGHDQPHSPLRPAAQVSQEPVADFTVPGPVTGAHGRHYRPVLQHQPADAHRPEEVVHAHSLMTR